jgi:hypothetical protein
MPELCMPAQQAPDRHSPTRRSLPLVTGCLLEVQHTAIQQAVVDFSAAPDVLNLFDWNYDHRPCGN